MILSTEGRQEIMRACDLIREQATDAKDVTLKKRVNRIVRRIDALKVQNIQRIPILEDEDLTQAFQILLTPGEACVLCFRFGLLGFPPMTLDQIATLYGVTRERIRQMESRAMTKIKHPVAPIIPSDGRSLLDHLTDEVNRRRAEADKEVEA